MLRRLRPSVVIASSLAVAAAAALATATVTVAAGNAAKPPRPPAGKKTAAEKEARAFLEAFTPIWLPVATAAAGSDWAAATDVTPEHTGERTGADKALAALTGSKLVIDRAKALLAREKDLDDVTARQLRKLLLAAAESPGTIPEVAARRVEVEARQGAIQDGFTFCFQPKPTGGCAKPATANDIDAVLLKSRDLAERQRVWTASKEIGRPLKSGLGELQQLRNQVAKEMGYSSFFALQVADYGMTVPEMMALLDSLLETTRPLYQGLHCWAKNALAKRYGRPAPAAIPAHWIGNRWAQRWPGHQQSKHHQWTRGQAAQ
jgi:peptidyl-dipeptidase A